MWILQHKDCGCAMKRPMRRSKVTLFTCSLVEAAWLIQSWLKLIKVWRLDWSQKMLGVHMTWLIADYGTFKNLLHITLLISGGISGYLIDFRSYIFNITLFALLLDSWLCIEWCRLFVPPTKSRWSILWITSFTWWHNHDLLWCESRMNLIAQSLLLLISLSIQLIL